MDTPTDPDAVVFKFGASPTTPAAILDALMFSAARQKLPATAADFNLSVDGAESYVYLWLRSPAAVEIEPLRDAVARAAGIAEVAASRLAGVQDLRGASHRAPVAFHYVVETDVVPAAERDLNDWYNHEHLPGLAAVPGTVRARRLINLDGAPRHHSCYELVSAETFGSPPWLAVRHTAWSDRVRPHFRNSKRTMFRRLLQRSA